MGPSFRRLPQEKWLWLGYAALALVLFGVGLFATRALQSSVEAQDKVVVEDAWDVIHVERLRATSATLGRKARSYLVAGDESFLSEMDAFERQLDARLEYLHSRINEPEGERLLTQAQDALRRLTDAIAATTELQAGGGDRMEVSALFEARLQPAQRTVDGALARLLRHEEGELARAHQRAGLIARGAFVALLVMVGVSLLLAATVGGLLARALAAIKRQHRELQENIERVDAVNRDLDAFAGRIAHDLKGILAPLTLVAYQLRQEGEANAQQAERLDRTCRRATDMLDGLLAFSRAKHRLAVDQPGSMAATLESVLEDLKPLEASVGARVETLLADDADEVLCSPGLLGAVLQNLIGNALKFMRDRPERTVYVRTRREGSWCLLTVQDTGPGIAKEAQRRIFEPFYRAPSSTAPGTGIGLATVQRIVEAHTGRVAVESEVGHGATFRVWLPLATARLGASPARLSSPEPVADAH